MATGGARQSVYSTEADDAVGGRVSNLCQPCDRDNKATTATLRCTTCDERLCDKCSKIHQIYIPGNHVFVDYHDVTNRRTLVDMKGFDKCLEHGNTVVYQCRDHNNVLCCEDCHYESHKRCDNLIKLLQLAHANDTENDLRDNDQDILECMSIANSVASDSDKKTTELQTDNICDEIDRAKNKIINLLDEAKACLQQELTESNKKEIQRLQTRKATALSLQKELGNSQSVHQLVKTNGTEIQKYIMTVVSQNKLQQAKAKLNGMLKHDYTVERKLEWDQHVLNVLNMDSIDVVLKVGKIVYSFVTVVPRGSGVVDINVPFYKEPHKMLAYKFWHTLFQC